MIDALRMAAEWIEEDSGREVDADYKVSVTDALRCPQQFFFKLRDAPVDPVVKMHVDYVNALGRAAHAVVEATIGGEREVPVIHIFEKDGARVAVTGRADLVVRDAVVEIKSYAYRSPQSYIPVYAVQAVFYAAVLGKGKAYLLMFNRAIPEIEVVPLHRYRGFKSLDREIRGFEELKKRAVEIVEERAWSLVRILRGESPSPEPGKWCRFCPYRHLCVAGGERILFPEFSPDLFEKKLSFIG